VKEEPLGVISCVPSQQCQSIELCGIYSRLTRLLHDLANDGGFVALKRAAEDREGWRHRERMSNTCCTAEVQLLQKTTDDKACFATLVQVIVTLPWSP